MKCQVGAGPVLPRVRPLWGRGLCRDRRTLFPGTFGNWRVREGPVVRVLVSSVKYFQNQERHWVRTLGYFLGMRRGLETGQGGRLVTGSREEVGSKKRFFVKSKKKEDRGGIRCKTTRKRDLRRSQTSRKGKDGVGDGVVALESWSLGRRTTKG